MRPCKPPKLVVNPETATDSDLALEKLEIGKWGGCNFVKFTALSKAVESTYGVK